MIMIQRGRLIAVLAMLFLAPTSVVLADGFSGGIGDTFGPRFGTDPNRAPHGPREAGATRGSVLTASGAGT